MNNKLIVVALIGLCLASTALAAVETEASDNNLLPTLDVVSAEKALDLDDEQGSGEDVVGDAKDEDYDDDDDYYYDDDDEDYDDEDYDDEDEDPDWVSDESSGDYDDDDEDLEEEIKGGDEEEISLDVKVTSISGGGGKDDDWHFADEENDEISKLDRDLLYEYFASEYEGDDYDFSPEEVEIERKRPPQVPPQIVQQEAPKPTLLSSGNWWASVFVVSGLVSFALFTLVFVLCLCRRQQQMRKSGGPSGSGKLSSNLLFVVGDHRGMVGKASSHSSTPIVKNLNYAPVPAAEPQHSTSSGIENSSHILQNSLPQKESENPLLP